MDQIFDPSYFLGNVCFFTQSKSLLTEKIFDSIELTA